MIEEKPVAIRDAATGRHPFWMWVLIFGYALISIAGWVRMVQTFIDWDWLNAAHVWPGPFYLAATGALWGVAGMVVVIWLWLRRKGARQAAFGIALFLALTFWADRLLLLGMNPYGGNNLFAAGVTLIGLIFTGVVLQPWDEIRSFKKG